MKLNSFNNSKYLCPNTKKSDKTIVREDVNLIKYSSDTIKSVTNIINGFAFVSSKEQDLIKDKINLNQIKGNQKKIKSIIRLNNIQFLNAYKNFNTISHNNLKSNSLNLNSKKDTRDIKDKNLKLDIIVNTRNSKRIKNCNETIDVDKETLCTEETFKNKKLTFQNFFENTKNIPVLNFYKNKSNNDKMFSTISSNRSCKTFLLKETQSKFTENFNSALMSMKEIKKSNPIPKRLKLKSIKMKILNNELASDDYLNKTNLNSRNMKISFNSKDKIDSKSYLEQLLMINTLAKHSKNKLNSKSSCLNLNTVSTSKNSKLTLPLNFEKEKKFKTIDDNFDLKDYTIGPEIYKSIVKENKEKDLIINLHNKDNKKLVILKNGTNHLKNIKDIKNKEINLQNKNKKFNFNTKVLKERQTELMILHNESQFKYENLKQRFSIKK